ncbi:MAG: alpha/beta family hydrolase [Myxococcota bacterium]
MNTNVKFESTEIPVTPGNSVSGVVCTPEWWPSGQRVGIVLAHDTDGNIEQEKLAELQRALAERGNLTLRFNFPYVQAGKKRPDPPAVLERAYKAATASLLRDKENAPARLVIGGYGLGARVAASVVAQGLKVDGVVCLGFPLHPSGKPNQQRASALFRIICPMLFVQGARDAHCRVDRMEILLRRIGAPTDLRVIDDCGQGLELIKRAERSPEQVRELILQAIEGFLQKIVGAA